MSRKRNYKKQNPHAGKGGWDPKANSTHSKSGTGPTSKSDSSTSPTSAGSTDLKDNSSSSSSTTPESSARPVVGPNNDPEWYSKDNQLVIDAASLPFSEPLGEPVLLMAPNTVVGKDPESGVIGLYSGGRSNALPGIMTHFTKASFGYNDDIKSPLNVSAQMLYTHVRYMNSGRKNYDPADLMIYVGSMADVYSYIVWMERIYAKAFVYSQRNKYIGKALLTSEYVAHESIVANLANMRYWINAFINKVSAYAIPADISYFNRRAWIYSSIYIENQDGNVKDQLYQFSPDGFYRFNMDETHGGRLEYKKLSQIVGRDIDATSPMSYVELISIGNWLLENVTGDEDFGLMSGDIIKAFNGNIIGIPSLPEVVDIIPVYSEYVLLQFHNATVLDLVRGESDWSSDDSPKYGDVYQDPLTGIIYSKEAVNMTVNQNQPVAAAVNKILDQVSPMPNPIDNMEASRLMCSRVPGDSDTDNFMRITCGADVVVKMGVVYVNYSGDIREWSIISSAVGETIAAMGTIVDNLWVASGSFKYSPILYLYLNSSGTQVPTPVSEIHVRGQINNYTIVDPTTLSKLHEVALLSMLSVPGVAKLINITQ